MKGVNFSRECMWLAGTQHCQLGKVILELKAPGDVIYPGHLSLANDNRSILAECPRGSQRPVAPMLLDLIVAGALQNLAVSQGVVSARLWRHRQRIRILMRAWRRGSQAAEWCYCLRFLWRILMISGSRYLLLPPDWFWLAPGLNMYHGPLFFSWIAHPIYCHLIISLWATVI
jgi:hypothetical protein